MPRRRGGTVTCGRGIVALGIGMAQNGRRRTSYVAGLETDSRDHAIAESHGTRRRAGRLPGISPRLKAIRVGQSSARWLAASMMALDLECCGYARRWRTSHWRQL